MPLGSKQKEVADKEFLSVAELAGKLGVSDDCIYIMVRRKEIPHIRLLTRIVFRKEIIDSWIKDQESQNYNAK